MPLGIMGDVTQLLLSPPVGICIYFFSQILWHSWLHWLSK